MNISDEEQKELRASEIRYRRLFESACDGILVLDFKTRKIIDVNPSFVKLLECSRDEILGKELREIGLFNDKNESLTAFREMEAANCVHFQDLQIKTIAGKHRDVELIGNVYDEETRRVIQFNIRDITERKQIEKEREQMAEETALLAQIANRVAKLGGWTIELPENTLTWSDENCAIHEVPPGYKPTLEEGINYFPPEYRDEVIRYVEICAKDGTPYDFELPKYTAKGRLIWVRSIGEAVRDAEGKIIRLQGAFQDITAHKQAQTEKENLIKELKEALAELRTLREFLPICSYCRKIRDDENYWLQIENYISKHTDTKFSHGICPECYEKEVIPRLERMKQEIN